jgi:hypothetical protein
LKPPPFDWLYTTPIISVDEYRQAVSHQFVVDRQALEQDQLGQQFRESAAIRAWRADVRAWRARTSRW